MTTEPMDPHQMRVGYAEREQAVERLARAHSLGQLDVDEFHERAAMAHVARTSNDLAALLKDLPTPPTTASRSRVPAATRQVRAAGAHLAGVPRRVWVVLAMAVMVMMIGTSLLDGSRHEYNGPPIMLLVIAAGTVVAVRRHRARRAGGNAEA